jgi:hypothetical protein
MMESAGDRGKEVTGAGMPVFVTENGSDATTPGAGEITVPPDAQPGSELESTPPPAAATAPGEARRVLHIAEEVVRSMFEPPRDAIARRRSELRVRPELTMRDTSTYRDAERFDECEAVHSGIVASYNTAKHRLFETLGITSTDQSAAEAQDTPDVITTALPSPAEKVTHTTWHRPRNTEADTPPNKIYEVTVHLQDGSFCEQDGEQPVAVKSYTIITPEAGIPPAARELTGTLTGSVVFEGDATVSVLDLDDVADVQPLDDIARRIEQRLRHVGQQEVLKPWCEALIHQPGVPRDIYPEHVGLVEWSPLDLIVTGTRVRDMTDAAVVLRAACGDAGMAAIPQMLDYPMDKLLPVLERSPELATRYAWFVGNIADMRGNYVRAGREALATGFADTFLSELPSEQARADRLRALADILETMENVTDSAPEPLPAPTSLPDDGLSANTDYPIV